MRRLYLLIMFFVGFTLSGCAMMSSTDTPPTPKATPAPQASQTAPPQKVVKAPKKTEPKQCPYIKKKKPSDPVAIQVYPKGSMLQHPYTVLAHKSISTFNAGGIKRQDANIHDSLRDLAASMGGDAVIDVTRNQKEVTGTIVSFQKDSIG